MSPWPSVITLNIFYRFYALHGEYKSFFQHSIIESATSTVGIELASSVWAILGDLGLRSFINRRDAPQTILGYAQGLYDAYTMCFPRFVGDRSSEGCYRSNKQFYKQNPSEIPDSHWDPQHRVPFVNGWKFPGFS